MIVLIRFVVVAALTLPALANAQRCGASCANAESILGLSEQTLIASIPELKRIPKPAPGPGKSRGKWMLPDVSLATQAFSATIFVVAGRVSRIEYLSMAPRHQCTQRIPFELAMSELARSYGESHAFGSFDGGGRTTQSASFSTQDMDVALHLSLSPEDCSTRVIFKPRDERDASNL